MIPVIGGPTGSGGDTLRLSGPRSARDVGLARVEARHGRLLLDTTYGPLRGPCKPGHVGLRVAGPTQHLDLVPLHRAEHPFPRRPEVLRLRRVLSVPKILSASIPGNPGRSGRVGQPSRSAVKSATASARPVNVDEVAAVAARWHAANDGGISIQEQARRIPTACWDADRHLPAMEDKQRGWRASAGFTLAQVVMLTTDRRIPGNRCALYALRFLSGVRPGEAANCPARPRSFETAAVAVHLGVVVQQSDACREGHEDRRNPPHPSPPRAPGDPRKAEAHGREEFMGRPPEAHDLVFPREDGKQRLVSGSYKQFKAELGSGLHPATEVVRVAIDVPEPSAECGRVRVPREPDHAPEAEAGVGLLHPARDAVAGHVRGRSRHRPGGLGGGPDACNQRRGYNQGYRQRDGERKTPDIRGECRGRDGAGKGI